MAHVTCTCVRTPKRIRAPFSFSSEEKERKRGAFQFYCPPYGTISIMKYFGVHFRPPSELHSTYSTIIEIRVGARSLLLGHMIEESWRTPLGHVYTHSWPLSSFLFIPFSLSLFILSLNSPHLFPPLRVSNEEEQAILSVAMFVRGSRKRKVYNSSVAERLGNFNKLGRNDIANDI